MTTFINFTRRNFKLTTLLLLVCLTLVIEITAQETAVLLEQAKKSFERERFDEAIVQLSAIIAREPNNEDALTQRARAFILQKKVAEASADAEKALAINPKNLFALNVRGMVKGANKDYQGAISDFTQAVTIDPTFYRSYYQRARVRMFLKANLAKVLEDFDLSLKYNENAGILQEAGNYCLENDGSPQVCAAYFTKIKAQLPNSAVGYLGYALAYFNAYEDVADKSIFKGEILTNLRKAVELDPKDEIAPLQLGRLLFQLADYDGSITSLNHALTINPKRAWTYALRADGYRLKNDYDNVIADYSKAIEIAPDYRDAYKFRATIRFEKGGRANIGYKTDPDKLFWKQTFDDYKKVAELSAQNYESYDELDNFAFKLGRFAAGQLNSPSLEGQFEREKDDYYKSLIAADAKNVCARYFLLQSSDYFRAKAEWDALINNYDGKNGAKCAADAALWIGRNYAQGDRYQGVAQNYDKAKEYYDLVLRFDPKNSYVKNWIAQLPSKMPVISTGRISDSSSGSRNGVGERQNNPQVSAQQDQAIRRYNEVHRQVEGIIEQYNSAVEKYNKAGEAQFLYKGTLGRIYRLQESAARIIEDFLDTDGKYLPKDLYKHMVDDYRQVGGVRNF